MMTQLLAGTSKGLVIFTHADQRWSIETVQFEGLPVTMVYEDPRTRVRWAGISHRHWGEKLHHSTDLGRTWVEAALPSYRNYFYKPNIPATLKRMWVMQHGGGDRPGCLWLGTEPGGLFVSDDDGNHFRLVDSLWNHASRADETQWFGAGKDYPFIHSIVLDPDNSDHLYIGISCAGVFETLDGGRNWYARNKGLKATYLPNPTAEMGHDPHRLLMCPSNTKVIWQQNHCGIFRSVNGGADWSDVSGGSGFPKYGFALAIDEADENTAWVIPAQSDLSRIPVGLKLTVCKTIDGGRSWKSMSHGLPDTNAFDLVLRQSFVKKGIHLCFGTTNGNLYASQDHGEEWQVLSNNLASINCLAIS